MKDVHVSAILTPIPARSTLFMGWHEDATVAIQTLLNEELHAPLAEGVVLYVNYSLPLGDSQAFTTAAGVKVEIGHPSAAALLERLAATDCPIKRVILNWLYVYPTGQTGDMDEWTQVFDSLKARGIPCIIGAPFGKGNSLPLSISLVMMRHADIIGYIQQIGAIKEPDRTRNVYRLLVEKHRFGSSQEEVWFTFHGKLDVSGDDLSYTRVCDAEAISQDATFHEQPGAAERAALARRAFYGD